MWQRSRTYYAKFMKDGREIRKSLSTDYRVACQMLNDLRARVDRNDYGLLDNDEPWDDIKAAFLRWAKQSVRNPQDYARDLRRFEDHCHPRTVAAVTPERIHAYREWRLDQGVTPRTVIEGAHRHGSVDIHSLRVSFTTLSIEHGANPRAIQAILGHSTLAMTMSVYAKATDSGKRDAINALPFAMVSPPDYVLEIPPAGSLQNRVQEFETSPKPLKNKGKLA